jgi:hypothetical protein
MGQEQYVRHKKRDERIMERRQVWKAKQRKKERRKREDEWQVKQFMMLTSDFDEVDVAWMLNFDRLQQQVYMFSYEDKTAGIPLDLEWPITWALARYNRKHIVCTKTSHAGPCQ